jgi:hypothetical protein
MSKYVGQLSESNVGHKTVGYETAVIFECGGFLLT